MCWFKAYRCGFELWLFGGRVNPWAGAGIGGAIWPGEQGAPVHGEKDAARADVLVDARGGNAAATSGNDGYGITLFKAMRPWHLLDGGQARGDLRGRAGARRCRCGFGYAIGRRRPLVRISGNSASLFFAVVL